MQATAASRMSIVVSHRVSRKVDSFSPWGRQVALQNNRFDLKVYRANIFQCILFFLFASNLPRRSGDNASLRGHDL